MSLLRALKLIMKTAMTTSIFKILDYTSWVCQHGALKMTECTFLPNILPNTRGIRKNGGEVL